MKRGEEGAIAPQQGKGQAEHEAQARTARARKKKTAGGTQEEAIHQEGVGFGFSWPRQHFSRKAPSFCAQRPLRTLLLPASDINSSNYVPRGAQSARGDARNRDSRRKHQIKKANKR